MTQPESYFELATGERYFNPGSANYADISEKFLSAHTAQQLARLSDGNFERIDDRDDRDARLARHIAIALTQAGFTLYDRVRETPCGGASVMPTHDRRGVYVSWTLPDSTSNRDTLSDNTSSAVTELAGDMNAALAWYLDRLGFTVTASPPHIVTDGPDAHVLFAGQRR